MEDPNKPREHTNIAEVGVGDKRYTVRQIVGFIDNGEEFYTTNKNGRYPRDVITCECGGKGSRHIRSAPDDRTDNNLESQRDCGR